MAWIDADPEQVRRECTPKKVQEAFKRKWWRDANNKKRVAELEAALIEIRDHPGRYPDVYGPGSYMRGVADGIAQCSAIAAKVMPREK